MTDDLTPKRIPDKFRRTRIVTQVGRRSKSDGGRPWQMTLAQRDLWRTLDEYADADGSGIRLSWARIRLESGLSQKGAVEAHRWLVEHGWLLVSRGHKGSTSRRCTTVPAVAIAAQREYLAATKSQHEDDEAAPESSVGNLSTPTCEVGNLSTPINGFSADDEVTPVAPVGNLSPAPGNSVSPAGTEYTSIGNLSPLIGVLSTPQPNHNQTTYQTTKPNQLKPNQVTRSALETSPPSGDDPQASEPGGLTATGDLYDFLIPEDQQQIESISHPTNQPGSDDVVTATTSAGASRFQQTTKGPSPSAVSRRIYDALDGECNINGLRGIVRWGLIEKSWSESDIERACLAIHQRGAPITKMNLANQVRKQPDANGASPKAARARQAGANVLAQIRAKKQQQAEEAS